MNIYLLIIILLSCVILAGNRIEFEDKKDEKNWVIITYILLLIQVLLLIFGVIL